MADDRDRLPKALDCANITSWAEWKQNFLVWMIANKRIGDDEKTKIATFVWLIGDQGRSIYNTLFPNDGSEKSMLGEIIVGEGVGAGVIQRTLDDVIKKFVEFCLPKRNVAMESFKFNTIVQKEKQQFIEFETELRKQLPFCEFKCECGASYENRMLRDRIIIGVADKKLQLKLLDGRDETLTKILETCKIYESAHVNKSILDSKPIVARMSIIEETQQTEHINAINRVCFNCGGSWDPKHREQCKAKETTCNKCGKRGHFARCCRQRGKKLHGQTKMESNNKMGEIGSIVMHLL